MRDRLFRKRMCSDSHNLFRFLEITDNISEIVQLETLLLQTTNKKRYRAC